MLPRTGCEKIRVHLPEASKLIPVPCKARSSRQLAHQASKVECNLHILWLHTVIFEALEDHYFFFVHCEGEKMVQRIFEGS